MKTNLLSRLLIFCSLFLTLSVAKAQYVAIPDTNFGIWLYNNGYATCLTGNSNTGWQLDTTCPAVSSAGQLGLISSNIYDLTGIEYFRNITFLNCNGNYLTFLPVLPGTITFLTCLQNSIDSIPVLPASLQYLILMNNRLTHLPPLPATLISAQLDENILTSLPALPASLTSLSCNTNALTSLPALPASLLVLSCNNNHLSSLPALPSHLTTLFFSYNTVAVMPALPTVLRYLLCEGNHLGSFPAILPDSLLLLNCSGNPAIGNSIPALPPMLTEFDCYNDSMAVLPALPAGLTKLECQGNANLSLPSTLPQQLATLNCNSTGISSLPVLPPTITSLSCGGNPLLSCLPRIYQNHLSLFHIYYSGITCIPDHFSASTYDVNPATMPLCDPASGCDFYYNVAGNVHLDTAATCMLDSLHPGQPITNMKVQLKQNGQVVQQFYSFNSGGYSFKTDSLSTYTVDLDTTALPLAVVCPASGIDTVALSPTDTVEKYKSFGMQCAAVDFGVTGLHAHHFRPGYTTTVGATADNISLIRYNANCGAATAGTVTVSISGPEQYAGPAAGALTPSSVTGLTVTYTVADLNLLQPHSLDFIVTTDAAATIGMPICITAIITPAVPDANPANDTLKICTDVGNSLDPNLKSVYPLDIISAGDWLTYTVDFQNTGNDTAYTVVVKDTLSANVDASTFQYLASSSRAVIQLFGSAMVFTFPKINLLDSAAGPALSTGWIQYRVKTKANLPIGTQVKNTAAIYFDHNPAVVTNTTVNTVDTTTAPLAIKTINTDSKISLYPNPNNGSFTLHVAGENTNNGMGYIISDMLGNVIEQKTITSNKQQINMTDAAEGVYTLMVKGARPVRFVMVK
jgi:uncharacterized repeat protein (TIGR01451 family)